MKKHPTLANVGHIACDGFHEARGLLTLICGSISSVLLCSVVIFAADSAWGETSPWFVKSIHYEPLGASGFQSISGMATDPVSGEIYVLHAGRHTVDVIDSAGSPRYTFTHWITDQKTGRRTVGEPNSIAISPSGEIFLTDLFSRWIDVLNIPGEVIDHIDMLADVGWQGPSVRPEKLGLDADGWLYASIGGERSGVLRRRVEGGHAKVFIDAAKEKIECITGTGVAADGRVAVLDSRGTPAVRVYDASGRQIVAFAGHEVEQGDLSFPAAMLFAGDGTFWVAGGLRQAVKHHDEINVVWAL